MIGRPLITTPFATNASRISRTPKIPWLSSPSPETSITFRPPVNPKSNSLSQNTSARLMRVLIPTRGRGVARNRLRATPRPRVGINTLISRALVFCDRLFDFGFTGGRKVIDVSGDGDDNQGIFGVREIRDALVAKGVVINGLPIIVKPPEYIFPPQPPEGLEVYYRRNVVGGDGHVVIESIGFDNFKQAILQKLLLEIG